MPRAISVAGEVTQATEPRWGPLEAALGTGLAGWFMWMYEIRLTDGNRVDAYKHDTTRQYLHLATDRRAFAYGPGGRYQPVDLATAIREAFDGWEMASPQACDVRALASAIRSARVASYRSIVGLPGSSFKTAR